MATAQGASACRTRRWRRRAAERQQLVVAALGAAQPEEAMGQDAALEEGLELVLDESRQLDASAGLGVGDELP